jgi:DNA-binding CsgD family transcriptional regulator
MGTRRRDSYAGSVLDGVAEARLSDAGDHAEGASLTPRELEVLQMISSGLTNAEAARRLDLSIHAIKFHLASIYRRLGVSNRTEAAVRYLQLAERARSAGRSD